MIENVRQAFDLEKLQGMLDSIKHATGLTAAVLDADGKLLAEGADIDLCAGFLTGHPELGQCCIEDRKKLAAQVTDAAQPVISSCPYGLASAAAPLRVNGVCLGGLLLGKVFLEPPDRERFRELARRAGFDQERLLAAVDRVPVLTREQFNSQVELLISLTTLLADQVAARLEAGRAAGQLRETLQLLDQSQQIALVGGWKLNPETRELQWTDQVYRLLELSPDTPITADYANAAFLHAAGDGLLEQIRLAWENGTAFSVECQLKSSGGRLFWAHFRCTGKVETPDGPFLIGTVQDVDARKRLELEAMQWQQVFEQSEQGLALSDLHDETFIAVNPAYARRHGYLPQELIGSSIYTVYAPESHDQLHELLLTEGNKAHVVYESIHIRKDGSRFPVRVEITAIKDEAGRQVSRVSSIIDITEQIAHAERSIRHIRSQKAQLGLYAATYGTCNELMDAALEELVDLTESGFGYLFSYDEENRVLVPYSWSRTVKDSCTMQNTKMLYRLDEMGLWGEAVRRRQPVVTNDYAAPNPFKKGLPEGHPSLIRHLNLPILRDDRIVAVVGVGNKPGDYTEDDIRQVQLLMEGCWHALERMTAMEELQAAKSLAEESLRVKTELLSNLSHELRTPLNGVFGGAQLLGFTELSDEQHLYLDMIEVAASNELSLINNLLEMVKMESEGISLVRERFPLRRSVEEVVRLHQGAAREKGLRLGLEIVSSTPDEVVGDMVRFRQILFCLLGNAIKFTEQGGVTVRLGARESEDGTMQLRLGISDTGIGIAAADQERIFDLLTQFDMSSTRKYGGLGLGLAISRRLAVSMGGRITVESTPGSGSTFTLELPLEPLPSGQHRVALNRSILLVEDDSLNAQSSAALLRKMGHKVMIAPNGDSAVSQWQKSSFDLVLMDIQMPGISGFEALQRIRDREKESGRPRTPVVAQTAYVRRNYHESFIGAGFDGFLAKPLLREELEAMIEKLC